MAETKLFQDSKTGKLVEFISKHDKEFAMVKDAGGNVTFMTLDQLIPYDAQKGRMAKVAVPIFEEPEEKAPEAVVPPEVIDSLANWPSIWSGYCHLKEATRHTASADTWTLEWPIHHQHRFDALRPTCLLLVPH